MPLIRDSASLPPHSVTAPCLEQLSPRHCQPYVILCSRMGSRPYIATVRSHKPAIRDPQLPPPISIHSVAPVLVCAHLHTSPEVTVALPGPSRFTFSPCCC